MPVCQRVFAFTGGVVISLVVINVIQVSIIHNIVNMIVIQINATHCRTVLVHSTCIIVTHRRLVHNILI